MLTDLDRCSNDFALRRLYRYVSHQQIGFQEDCISVVVCKPTEAGWRASWSGQPECSAGSSAKLVPPLTDHLCDTLDPPPADAWYDRLGFERVRHRYRFGTAARDQCAVPAWMLVKEETLRLYSLIQSKSRVARVLINIGAADGVTSDPLGGILRTFASPGPWKGIYFEAAQENCLALRKLLDETGARIHVECGYTTPTTVAQTICQELRHQEIPGITEVCDGAATLGMSMTDDVPADVRVEVDAMNVDIDSFDCAVLREALRLLSPKMIVVEIFPYPPPIVVASDFHPYHQETERNISGAWAKLGGTARKGAFVPGCSLSAAIALLWPHGLGLYRLSARDALFVRGDVAREILGPTWVPADEFQCWRKLCADLSSKENLMKLTSLGVYDFLMPFVHQRIRDVLLNGSYPMHPLSVGVAMPPPAHDLPDVKRFGSQGWNAKKKKKKLSGFRV